MNSLQLPRRVGGLLAGALTLLLTGLLGGQASADSAARPGQASVATSPPDVFQNVARIVAVGDIHGDFERLQQVLRLCKLTDTQDQWIGGKAHLVQTGDVLDRGPDSKKAMDLLMALELQARRAGGAVHALIGNHEFMILTGDLRYVSNGELAAFADGPRSTPVGSEPGADFPTYRKALGPSGKYGQWIMGHNAVIKINDTLFMHGGLSPRFMNRKLRDLNDAVRDELAGRRDARTGVGANPEGPLWYRGLAESMQLQAEQALLADLTRAQGAQRIVMGHTIQDHGITLRADGHLALIDVGMSRWTLSGAPSCLELTRTPKGDQLTILK